MQLSTPYSDVFLWILGIYVLATILYCLRIIFEKKFLSGLALRLSIVGFLIHAVFLILHLYNKGYPFFVSSFETLQVTSGSIILVFLVLCIFYRFRATGVLFLPLGLLFYVISLTWVVGYRYPGHFLENPWAFTHLVFIFISIAVFMASFIMGILYLVQELRIKRKITGGFLDRLPSLEIMDLIHYRALYVGFIFFTVGIITGAGWSKSTLDVYISTDVKQLLSLALWVFFALFLNLRVSRGWKGKKGILLSSLGFIAVIFLLMWVQR